MMGSEGAVNLMRAAVTLLLLASSVAGAADRSLESLDLLQPHNVLVAAVTHLGRGAVKVEFTEGLQGSNPLAFATLPVDFRNGVIEVDVAAEANGKGPPEVRGFAGLALHIPTSQDKYEAIYLRMSNGRLATPTPPEPRFSRAIQYIAHPGFDFDVSRKDFPGKYEAGANIAPGGWVRLRLEVDGSVLKAFVNGENEPALTVSDLKLGNTIGKIGLWTGVGTAAYFSNVSIRPAP